MHYTKTQYYNMINLEKYKSDNGFFNATELVNDYCAKSGVKKDVLAFFYRKGHKFFMADLVILMNSLSGGKVYNKNTIKMSKFGQFGCTLLLPELFAKFALWIYKDLKKDVFTFLKEHGYKFDIEDQEMANFVATRYFRYYEGDFDVLAMHREVDLCRITPKNKSFNRYDVVEMNISMITNGVPFEARKNILYKHFL